MAIRLAKPSDAPAIRQIIQMALDETSSVTHIARVIGLASHQTHVIIVDEQVVGFVNSFQTRTQSGTIRQELDLIAIHPDFRGRGFGRELIRTNTASVTAQKTVPVRALIRDSNVTSQHAFRSAGFQEEPESVQLYVSTVTRRAAGVSLPDDAHLIPVMTLTYRGIWLEGQISEQAIRVAQHRNLPYYGITGAVVAAGDHAAIDILRLAGFEATGSFKWWTPV